MSNDKLHLETTSVLSLWVFCVCSSQPYHYLLSLLDSMAAQFHIAASCTAQHPRLSGQALQAVSTWYANSANVISISRAMKQLQILKVVCVVNNSGPQTTSAQTKLDRFTDADEVMSTPTIRLPSLACIEQLWARRQQAGCVAAERAQKLAIDKSTFFWQIKTEFSNIICC